MYTEISMKIPVGELLSSWGGMEGRKDIMGGGRGVDQIDRWEEEFSVRGRELLETCTAENVQCGWGSV